MVIVKDVCTPYFMHFHLDKCTHVSPYIPVLTDSFILMAQMGGSLRGARAPTSQVLRVIRKKGAMVTAHLSLLEKQHRHSDETFLSSSPAFSHTHCCNCIAQVLCE